MVKFAVVSSSDLAQTDSWVASLHILLAEHKPLADALLQKSWPDLVGYAKILPFDKAAADAIYPTPHGMSRHAFEKMLSQMLSPAKLSQRRKLSAYVAAAATNARAAIAQQVSDAAAAMAARLEQQAAVVGLLKSPEISPFLPPTGKRRRP